MREEADRLNEVPIARRKSRYGPSYAPSIAAKFFRRLSPRGAPVVFSAAFGGILTSRALPHCCHIASRGHFASTTSADIRVLQLLLEVAASKGGGESSIYVSECVAALRVSVAGPPGAGASSFLALF